MKSLIAFFVARPLLVNLLLISMVLIGWQVASHLAYESHPKVNLGRIAVLTNYLGASPEDIELSITVPLEEEILKEDGVKRLQSISMEGQSFVLIYTDENNSPPQDEKVLVDVKRAIDRAEGRLPSDLVGKPVVDFLDITRQPLMEVLIYGDVSEDVLRNTARRLQNQLRQVSGVSGVKREGYRNKEVLIQVDPAKLDRLAMSYDELMAAIKSRNVRDSSGSIESFSSEQDFVTVGEFESIADIESVIVRAGGAGNYVRIRDVAQVLVGYEDQQQQSFYNGLAGISLYPYGKASTNVVDVTQDIRTFLADRNEQLPAGVKLKLLGGEDRLVVAMLDMLSSSALAGICLVALVLLCFFPWRFCLWMVLGIPTAILISVTFLPLFGVTGNPTALVGFILMLGLLVDDAVVTGDSIIRHAEKGLAPQQAAIEGAYAVSKPVMTGGFITILAFAPIVFLGGIEGKFLWMLGVTVTLTLVASLFECKIMLPGHIAHALEKSIARGKSITPRVWFQAVEQRYGKLMLKFLKRRYSVLGIALVGLSVTAVLSTFALNIDLYPDTDVDSFFVKTELPIGTPLEETQHFMVQLETQLKQRLPMEAISGVKLTVGHHDASAFDLSEGKMSSWALIAVHLLPSNEREATVDELMALTQEYLQDVNGLKRFSMRRIASMPSNYMPLEIYITGDDSSRFEASETLLDFIERQAGVTDAWSNFTPGKDVIELVFNHPRIADYGLSVNQIAQAARVALDGSVFDEWQTVEDLLRIRVQYKESLRGSIDQLLNTSIVNKRGEAIPFRSVVSLNIKPSDALISHYFGERNVTVYANIDKKILSAAEIHGRVTAFIKDNALQQKYPKLQFIVAGEFISQQEAVGDAGAVFIVCLVAIFMVLILLFNSLSQPILIMAVIPMGIVGVFFAFAVQGFDLSMTGSIGILGLSGVLVNTALVMIHNLNVKRLALQQDVLCHEAIIGEATLRLRPTFITSVTTFVGLLPAAYGWFGEQPDMTPMMMSMLWGMFFGAIAIMFILPCMYAAEQDAKQWLKRMFS